MDPISAGLGIIGLGMNIFGGFSSAGEASKQAALSQQIGAQEQDINSQKHDQMMLSARRQQVENFRNVQRARAMGLNAAVSQGAQFGSGLQGGQAQATNQGYENDLGINQGVAIGNNIFADNSKISGLRSQISASQSSQATDQGIASLGSSLMGGAKTFGNLASGAGSFSFSNIFSGGGNYSGTPGASNTGGLY